MPAWKSLVSSETEAQFRQLWSYFYEQSSTGKANTGVVAGLGVTATTPSASGSVTVSAGLGVCQPTTGGGVFPLPNTTGALDVFTTDPMQFVGNPRNDIVVIDTADGAVKTLVGTPNATPALGEQTIPTTVLPLARLRHAANATTIPSSAIDDLRIPVAPLGAATEGFIVRGVPMAGASASRAGKRMHWDRREGVTTSSTGYYTVTHGAGFTPTAVAVTPITIPYQVCTDSYTSTTFRVRFASADGTPLASTSVSFSYTCGE